jgi:hypothetical protein
MGYYKVTNLTAKLPKRHQQKNSTLKLEYRANFDIKTQDLHVGQTLYISSPSLPVNLHKLRMKKLISVVEIGKNTFMKLQRPIPKPQSKVETKTTTQKSKSGRRKKTKPILVNEE